MTVDLYLVSKWPVWPGDGILWSSADEKEINEYFQYFYIQVEICIDRFMTNASNIDQIASSVVCINKKM